MNPKFSVGEVVIVQSPYYPESNGEYEVIDIFSYEKFRSYCNKTFSSPGDPIVYRLEGYKVVGNRSPDHITDCCSEPHLRKRHQKGDMSFKELVNDLKTNIQQRA